MDNGDQVAVSVTAPALTAQEMFDRVVRHMLTQRARSGGHTGGLCQYLDDRGNKCAIGCLIPEAAYHRGMEGVGIRDETDPRATEIRAVTGITDGLRSLAGALQDVHDVYSVSEWPRKLRDEASFYNVRVGVFDEPEMVKAIEACSMVVDDDV